MGPFLKVSGLAPTTPYSDKICVGKIFKRATKMSIPLSQENIWFNKAQCDDAERMYYEKLAGAKVDGLVALAGGDDMSLTNKLTALEVENKQLKKVTEDLKSLVSRLEARVAKLEIGGGSPAKPAAAPAPAPAPAEEEDDDDCDLFGSDEDEEDSEEKQKIVAERLKAYAERKAKKPGPIAKTNVLLDVKPWDDETDMDAMLKEIKTIAKDGLVWGANKLVPVGYGINKLQVMCVVEDEKVSIDELCEQICEFEDFVQSCDVNAMSKI